MNRVEDPEYPYQRQWRITSVDIDRYQTLQENWSASKNLIIKIREALSRTELHPDVYTVAAAGSIGRMEASPDVSDADLIIVLSDNVEDLGSEEATKAYDSVWNALAELKIQKPKPTGVFAGATTKKKLLVSVGDAEENYGDFGKRLLLLLETQPIYHNHNYSDLIGIIVDKYAEEYVKVDSKKEWTFLLNDLIRYFRAIAVNYQWSFGKEAEK